MIFEFDDAELDLDRYQLRRGGQAEAVEPQVFDLLAVLIRERHRVVSKEELLDTVWGNRFVSESALTSLSCGCHPTRSGTSPAVAVSSLTSVAWARSVASVTTPT